MLGYLRDGMPYKIDGDPDHPVNRGALHPATATTYGIEEGDRVRVSTRRGSIVQKAALCEDTDPRVVIAEHGWYFPEREDDLHGWAESNLNVLTGNDPPYARELGSVTLRGILCRIERAESEGV